MMDLSEMLRTQYDEFVDLLQTWPSFDLLKTKFCHLEAIVEHERLVKSVATVCDKMNAMRAVSDCKQDDCNLGLKCDQDDSVDSGCVRDDGGTDGTVGNKSEQNDRKPEFEFDRDVDNKCGQDDRNPETNCNRCDSLDNECKQDDCKPLLDCNQDDGKPELNEGNLRTDSHREYFEKNNEELLRPKTNYLTEDSFAEILKVNNQKLLDLL